MTSKTNSDAAAAASYQHPKHKGRYEKIKHLGEGQVEI
jgi:hypothetical protein